MMTKKFSVLLLSMFLFPTTPGFAQERVKLRISSATKTLGYGPLWVASKMGFFERQGLDVELVVIRASDVGIQALAGGSLEIVAEHEYPPTYMPKILDVATQPLAEKDPLLFRASYHLVKGAPTRPFSDHLVLDAKGRGRFVGCSLLVRNPSRIWWGEGDEKFTVDGEAFPSWFGTGTEDYFGYAWCDPTPFQAPFHAQVQCDGPLNFGFTQLHRAHLLDCVPFQKSFRFELERWHWVESTAIDYATVAYWYGAPGATSGLPPVPKAGDRALARLPSPPMFVMASAMCRKCSKNLVAMSS